MTWTRAETKYRLSAWNWPTLEETRAVCERLNGNAYHDVWVLFCESRSRFSRPTKRELTIEELEVMEQDEHEKRLAKWRRRVRIAERRREREAAALAAAAAQESRLTVRANLMPLESLETRKPLDTAQASIASTLVQNGIATRNETRQRFNLPRGDPVATPHSSGQFPEAYRAFIFDRALHSDEIKILRDCIGFRPPKAQGILKGNFLCGCIAEPQELAKFQTALRQQGRKLTIATAAASWNGAVIDLWSLQV